MCMPISPPRLADETTKPTLLSHDTHTQRTTTTTTTTEATTHPPAITSPKIPLPTTTTTARQNLTTTTTIACLSLFLLLTSSTLTLPHLQTRRETLLCDALCQGSLTSLRSTLALLGATLMGRLSDEPRVGRVVCLMVGNMAALVGLVMGVGVVERAGLFWSLVPASVFMQNFSVWKAVIVDCVKVLEEEKKEDGNKSSDGDLRAGSVGKLGMSAGISFMVGPFLGATLIKTYEQASYIGIGLIICSAALIAKLPATAPTDTDTTHTSKPTPTTSKNTEQKNKSIFQFPALPSSITPPALYLISLRILMALAFHIYSIIWTASLKSRFDFTPRDHGQFFSFIGFTYALSQGYIAKRILTPLGETGRIRTLQLACVALGFGRVIAFYLEDIRLVYGVFFGIIVSLGLVNTVMTADAARSVPSGSIGSLYGLLDAAGAGAGMIGPVLGGWLARVGGGKGEDVLAPLGMVVVLYGIVFLMITFGYKRLVLTADWSSDDADVNLATTADGDLVGVEKKKNV